MRQVLVVEADEVLTEMMIELLSRDGCAVTAVRSIGEAASCLSGGDADVDMVMFDADTVSVGMPSEGLIKWQEWLNGCARPPACMVASVQADSARLMHTLLQDPHRHLHDSGLPIWLRKPFRNDEFLSAVRQTAEARRETSAS